MKKDEKRKITLIDIIKKIKIRTIIFLIVLLAFNSYAWFLYATKVSTGLQAHVAAWDINFVIDNKAIEKTVTINLEKIYPGMEDFSQEIQVENKGETKADLKYEIESIKIFGETFSRKSGMTSQQLEEKIANEYPINLDIQISNNSVDEGVGKSTFTINLSWPFESNNDELDTYWGEKAYEYYSKNANSNSLELEINLIATQKQ